IPLASCSHCTIALSLSTPKAPVLWTVASYNSALWFARERIQYRQSDMEEDMAIIESILREEAEFNGEVVDDAGSGWKMVKTKSYRRNSSAFITPEFARSTGASIVTVDASSGVFRSLEREAEERRRRVVEAQRDAFEIAARIRVGTSRNVEVDDDEAGNGDLVEAASESAADRKGKTRKKMGKVTVSEAAEKIDADHLAAFLVDTSSNYEFQEDIQLTRFADFISRAFASVSSAQFPWQKLLKESSVAKMIDLPLAHLPEAVYKVSVDWINQRPLTSLGSFILWLWDGILADDVNYQGAVQGSKEVAQTRPSKSMVSIFVILAMILRRKPEVLISLFPVLKESPKYFDQNMLPLNVWLVSQVSEGDLCVGLYFWLRVLLPMLSEKSSPYTRDLVLQLAERIFSSPKAPKLLLNGTVRKGERLVPPSALEVLMRLTFPSPENRVKATERFEAIYPTLKTIALAGFQSKKAMKQVSKQLFSVAIHAAAFSNLSEEATDLVIWCLTVNSACYEQWENFYLDNIEASLFILRKLATYGKELSVKLSADSLRKTLKNFRKKNQTALASKGNNLEHSSLKEADKQCRIVLTFLSSDHLWLKVMTTISVLLGIFSILLTIIPMLSH
ncbi:hypothetical protein V2J09_003600, partial [Rumex salicifolius]